MAEEATGAGTLTAPTAAGAGSQWIIRVTLPSPVDWVERLQTRLGGGVSVQLWWPNTADPTALRLPAAIVRPLQDRTDGGRVMTHGVNHRVEARWGVELRVAQRQFLAFADDDLMPLRARVMAALLDWDWQPTEGRQIRFLEGRLLPNDEGLAQWLDIFAFEYYLSIR